MSHRFHIGPMCGPDAPSVATARRPVGARLGLSWIAGSIRLAPRRSIVVLSSWDLYLHIGPIATALSALMAVFIAGTAYQARRGSFVPSRAGDRDGPVGQAARGRIGRDGA